MSRGALAVAALAMAGVLLRSPTGPPWVAAVLLVAAFAAFALLVSTERRRPTLSRRTVLTASGLLLALAVAVRPRQSTDVWAYAMYGRMVAHHHVSPYRHAAEDFPGDPVAARVADFWKGSRSVYGPAFTGVSAAGMAVAGESRLAARLFFQLLAAAAVGAALLLVARRTRDPVALAFLGLNPLTVVSVVNGAHNDALVGLAVLAAVLLACDRRPGWAGAALGAGALVKVGALLPLGALAVWVWRRHGARDAVTVGGTGVAVVAGGCLAAGGTVVLAPLADAQLRFTSGSVWSGPRRWLTTGTAHLDTVRRRVASVANLTVVGLTLLLILRRLRDAEAALVVAASVLAYMLLGSYVTAWYIAWSLPALALVWRSRLAWLAVAHAALLQLATLPGTRPRVQADLYGVVLPAVGVAVVVALVAISLRPRRPTAREAARPRGRPDPATAGR
jgi:hypothetical protein